MRFHLKPFEPFIMAPHCNPVIHFHLHLQLPSYVFWPLIWLHLVVFSGIFLCLVIFMWGLDPELLFPPWEFHGSGVMLGEAPPQQTDQECTNQGGRGGGGGGGLLRPHRGNTALHCSPTFTFHSSPLSVLKSHPSTEHNLSVVFEWLLFHSFLPLLLCLLPNHLTWHFPAAKSDVLTENFIAFIGLLPMGGKTKWESESIMGRLHVDLQLQSKVCVP